MSRPAWVLDAFKESCKDDSWHAMVDDIHKGIKSKLRDMHNGKELAEVTNEEQTSLVEQCFREMMIGGKLENYYDFEKILSRNVDAALLDVMLTKSIKPVTEHDGSWNRIYDPNFAKDAEIGIDEALSFSMTKSKNKGATDKKTTLMDEMLDEVSSAVITLLETSPPTAKNSLHMFMGWAIPPKIGVHIWRNALRMGEQGTAPLMPANRITPSIDVMLTRRCHAILDISFVPVSSRANAAIIKGVVTNFCRMTGLKMPDTALDDFQEMDNLVYLVTILMVQLRSNANEVYLNKRAAKRGPGKLASVESEEERHPGNPFEFNADRTKTEAAERDSKTQQSEYEGNVPGVIRIENPSAMEALTLQNNILEEAVYNLLEPTCLGLIQVKDQKVSFTSKSPCFGHLEFMLEEKAPQVYARLWKIETNSNSINTSIGGEEKSYLRGRQALESLTTHGGGGTTPENCAGLVTKTTSIQDFCNEQLKRGLSGLLNIETCLFVWDQGFILDFGGVLPLVLYCLLIAASEEFSDLSQFSTMRESIISYCRTITVPRLQALMITHCKKEMMEMADITQVPSGLDGKGKHTQSQVLSKLWEKVQHELEKVH